MGDRYYLENLKCAYCHATELDEVFYAPTSNFLTFRCKECNKENFITIDFKTKKIEGVTLNDVFVSINQSSNFLNKEQIKKLAKETFERIKNG